MSSTTKSFRRIGLIRTLSNSRHVPNDSLTIMRNGIRVSDSSGKRRITLALSWKFTTLGARLIIRNFAGKNGTTNEGVKSAAGIIFRLTSLGSSQTWNGESLLSVRLPICCVHQQSPSRAGGTLKSDGKGLVISEAPKSCAWDFITFRDQSMTFSWILFQEFLKNSLYNLSINCWWMFA